VGDELGAVHEDVPFDWDGADTLITAFESMAQQIQDQRPSRQAAGAHALDQWIGQAVPLFVQRQSAGDMDAGELVDALRDAAEDVRALKRAAQEEQDRRIAAREYVAAYERNEAEESLWDDITDFFGGEDFEPPPMPPPPRPEPHLSSPTGSVTERS
jgi:hypothetical protein